MSRLEEMSVEDILDYIGMYLTFDNFKTIVNYDEEAINRIYKEIEANQRKAKNRDMLDRKTAYFVKNIKLEDSERLLESF